MSLDSLPPILQGRRILVTGAARGLGYDFAETFARAGARVVMVDILADVLAAAARKLQDAGLPVHGVAADLADPESVKQCAAQAVQWLGGLDGLVNNAAITNSGGVPARDLDVGVWDRVMQVNVRGTWLMSVACLDALAASGRGAIVNLASDTAMWGAPNLLAYTASKGAVISMTRSLAREFGAANVTVNAIAPGLTLVEATEYVPEARHRLYHDQRALQRDQMPADVSGPAVFALSDLARFVTGQVLPVNGGFVFN